MATLQSDAHDFKVAIAGGGLCGLACAIGLTRAGVRVEIYEAASKFAEIGAGVELGPNAIRVLEKLGVLQDVLARADQAALTVRPFLFVSGCGEHEVIYDYPVKPEDRALGIRRSAFLEALVQLVNPAQTHFNKRCVAVTENLSSDPSQESVMELTFADGTTAQADVVLGADGIKSAVRAFVGAGAREAGARDELQVSRALYMNTNAYRGLIPVAHVRELGLQTSSILDRPHCFVGPSKHIITFPINGASTLNVVAFTCDHSIPPDSSFLPPGHSWVAPRTRAELLADFPDMGPDVQKLLHCIDQPSVWFVHAVEPPLESYCRGGVALLGDAAHGMLPHLGAGAGQGLEDALALVSLLGHPQTCKANVQTVLRAYDTIRRPRAYFVQVASDVAGQIYDGVGPSGGTPADIRKDLEGMWEAVWRYEVIEDVQAAIQSLQVEGIFS